MCIRDRCGIVDRLLAKRPEERFAAPADLLQAVAALESTVAPGSRHLPSPLAWSDPLEWAAALPGRPLGQVSPTVRQHTRTLEMREATMRLQSVIEREALDRESSRRLWVMTGVASFAALAAGFAVGRLRTRRSMFFGRLVR